MERVRKAVLSDAPGIARVHIDTWRTTYVGIVPQAVLDGLSYEKSQARMEEFLSEPSGKQFVLVGEDETGSIAGFATAGPARSPSPPGGGEVYAIYIRSGAQRRGLGRRLMRWAARELARQGHRSLYVWSFALNHHARRFYEALGGQEAGRQTLEIGGASLEEVAYLWPNLGNSPLADS